MRCRRRTGGLGRVAVFGPEDQRVVRRRCRDPGQQLQLDRSGRTGIEGRAPQPPAQAAGLWVGGCRSRRAGPAPVRRGMTSAPSPTTGPGPGRDRERAHRHEPGPVPAGHPTGVLRDRSAASRRADGTVTRAVPARTLAHGGRRRPGPWLAVLGGAVVVAPCRWPPPRRTPGPVSMPAAAAAGTGYCPDDNGVTVVVDFSELGGDIVVRCAPGRSAGLQRAGRLAGRRFQPERDAALGTGLRLPDRGPPARRRVAADRRQPRLSRALRRHATDVGVLGLLVRPQRRRVDLQHSGPKNRDAIKGGFEGWSFSLNHGAGSSPPPA